MADRVWEGEGATLIAPAGSPDVAELMGQRSVAQAFLGGWSSWTRPGTCPGAVRVHGYGYSDGRVAVRRA